MDETEYDIKVVVTVQYRLWDDEDVEYSEKHVLDYFYFPIEGKDLDMLNAVCFSDETYISPLKIPHNLSNRIEEAEELKTDRYEVIKIQILSTEQNY